MIPAQAVEAAAKGIASANLRSQPWADLDDDARNHFRRDARAALEAAAPHMLAGSSRHNHGWLAKNRNTDGTVSIIGRFRDEADAERWATTWNESTGRVSAFVDTGAKE